jgi:hypothetical protein
MDHRSDRGNMKVIKFAVMPDATPESEAAVVWHTHSQIYDYLGKSENPLET